jgi:MFS family permease
MTEQQRIGYRQLTVLFLCSLAVLMYAVPLVRLLPIHASQMGASPTQVGVYLALVYSGLAISTLAAGWLSDRYQRRKATIVVAGLIASLSLALMSQASTLWQLSLATISTWFFGGITYTLFMILAGLHAGKDERGKVFGLLAITLPLAGVIATPIAGLVADGWGYSTLLAAYAGYALVVPVAALLIKDRVVAPRKAAGAEAGQEPQRMLQFHKGFYLLVVATFLMSLVSFVNSLGLSLTMHALTFSSTQIATTVAVGLSVAISAILISGWLSDRYPRSRVLALCYLGGGAGTLALAVAGSLWQFWIASMLMAVLTASENLSNALATDLAPKELVGKGLSFTNAARWFGAVAGFALAGYAIEVLGARAAFLLTFLLIPVSVLMVARIRQETDHVQEGVAPSVQRTP